MSATIATHQDALAPLRVISPAKQGEHCGPCASCGLYLWSEGGYRLPGLQGLFCSLACIECGITQKTGQTKKIPGALLGTGARLLAYLKTAAPEVYARLSIAKREARRCLECGVTLAGKRADSRFCSDTHRKRFEKSPLFQQRKTAELARKCPY